MTLPAFALTRTSSDPFPHFKVSGILSPGEADRALDWLRHRAPWILRVESFYEQHEFSLLSTELGAEIAGLVSPPFIEAVRTELRERFGCDGGLTLVDVSAHRLTAGQTIRIHNDFIGGEETHRLLIQLNDGWDAGRGGLLMLFAGEAPESLRHVVMPTHGSGFAFEISPASYHAVSSIKAGERYTLVYTFRRDMASE
ncbi:2OG-Fe(II) oxygenase [Methylorubrum rhodesianum]|uniref:2OG-Fe(II) oxygenase n=1 Tax=Methylorubrum rhodesianum TaxID=29427 RepID=A0ABU9ZFU2_9HYPH